MRVSDITFFNIRTFCERNKTQSVGQQQQKSKKKTPASTFIENYLIVFEVMCVWALLGRLKVCNKKISSFFYISHRQKPASRYTFINFHTYTHTHTHAHICSYWMPLLVLSRKRSPTTKYHHQSFSDFGTIRKAFLTAILMMIVMLLLVGYVMCVFLQTYVRWWGRLW